MPRWTPTSTLPPRWPGALALAGLAALACSAPCWATPPTANVAAGKATFATACMSCHQVGPTARNGFGPQLNGILGRPAGSIAGYRYSPAMQNAGIVWSAPTLAAFIRNPGRTVPGNKMRFFSLGYSDQKMADLLAYLDSLPAAPK